MSKAILLFGTLDVVFLWGHRALKFPFSCLGPCFPFLNPEWLWDAALWWEEDRVFLMEMSHRITCDLWEVTEQQRDIYCPGFCRTPRSRKYAKGTRLESKQWCTCPSSALASNCLSPFLTAFPLLPSRKRLRQTKRISFLCLVRKLTEEHRE